MAPSASVHVRVLTWASAASWLLPFAALVLLGFSERGAALLHLSSRALIFSALAASVPGLALGIGVVLGSRGDGYQLDGVVRRRAVLGAVTSALILVIAGVASIAGAAAGREARDALRVATDQAVREYPGWNGSLLAEGTSIYGFEIDPASELARLLLRGFDEPFRVVVFGVDNRAGSHEVNLDLARARLRRAGRAEDEVTESIPRADLLAHADAQSITVQAQLAPAQVGAGERVDGILAFFPAGASFRDVQSIEVELDGKRRAIPGKYFTLEAKHAIDSARR